MSRSSRKQNLSFIATTKSLSICSLIENYIYEKHIPSKSKVDIHKLTFKPVLPKINEDEECFDEKESFLMIRESNYILTEEQ